jgi:hypothetical protein
MGKTVIEHYELYDGKVKLDYWPKSHKYVIDNDRKIGVTTVTGIINKEALMLWPLQEAISYLKEYPGDLGGASTAYLKKQLRGTDAGTLGHEWLENYLRAIKDCTDVPDRMEKLPLPKVEGSDEYIRATDHNNMVDAIEKFIDWGGKHDVEVLEVEKIIYSKKYDYCGRFDAILKIDGKVYVIDFKTSNPSRDFQLGIYPENFSQMGGYDIAYTEEFPDFHIDGHAVINLSKKNGKMSIEMSEDRQINREFYLSTLGVKRSMQHWTNKLKYQDKE